MEILGITLLQKKKPRYAEVKQPVQGHKDCGW